MTELTGQPVPPGAWLLVDGESPSQSRWAVVLVVLTVSARRGDWTHYPWQPGSFVAVSAPAVSDPDHTLAVITGLEPVG